MSNKVEFNINIGWAVFWIGCFWLFTNDGNAAEFLVDPSDQSKLHLHGDIVPSDCAELNIVLASMEYVPTKLVILSSGGNVPAALCMANTVTQLGMSTFSDYALSAAAIVWLGGVERGIGFAGIVATHGAYINSETGPKALDEVVHKINGMWLDLVLLRNSFEKKDRDTIVGYVNGEPHHWYSLHNYMTPREITP